MTVFSLFSAEVDLFVESPVDFERAYRATARIEVAPGISATFIGLPDLLYLKQQAGRAQDLLDIDQLKALRKESNGD